MGLDHGCIPVGGYLTFDEIDFNVSNGVAPTGFALSGAHGDEVWLIEADATGRLVRFADQVEFIAAAEGESFGRWPNAAGDLYPMLSNTFGTSNSGPRIGPVIISEIMYHPTPPTPDDLNVYPLLDYYTARQTWMITLGTTFLLMILPWLPPRKKQPVAEVHLDVGPEVLHVLADDALNRHARARLQSHHRVAAVDLLHAQDFVAKEGRDLL